jgi:deferrochelatase/peroxidase EfeB
MAGESNGGRWLVEPPGPQEVNFHIAAGDQVVVTPAVREAFDHLIETLRGDDMQGFTYDPNCGKKIWECDFNGKCIHETQVPNCLIDYQCRIASIG